MNPVEIESALSDLAQAPFDADEFPYAFLAAFGHKAVALKRLKAGQSNSSDLSGAVLLRNHIHLQVCEQGQSGQALAALRHSPATGKGRAKFILATDGQWLEAEDLALGETLACAFDAFADHFGFFLPLAGISTVREIRDNPVDVRATGRLNKLYTQLLRDNPDWAGDERRAEMNHFMARLIFCFFAEDTDIFHGDGLFTRTLEQMGAPDATHDVMAEIFRAMNTPWAERQAAALRPWAQQFPYVNGGLFGGSAAVPRFSRIARTYLLHAGALKWREINPDIFGSMIQAVADEDERGQLGMHYTSAPNILKVLNPLFLDSLRQQLQQAGENPRKLLNLRKRIAHIRVFDPACGSGNFLVIAYKQMREIEAEINRRRGEPHRRSAIPLTNFRGIELRPFPAEIARLALIIAEFQCDVRYRGQKDALAEFLPLSKDNWITCGNALRLDWPALCPPVGAGVKLTADDLFETPLDQAEIDFANEGGETYLCGNPPYLGSTWQSAEQKADLQAVFGQRCKSWKSLDYVAGWFLKAADYARQSPGTASAFVATNSICQGQQVPILWPLIFASGQRIHFAHTSFKWANLASHNAGVTVAIVGMTEQPPPTRRLYSLNEAGETVMQEVSNINAYLVAGADVIVEKASQPLTEVAPMDFGNKPVDGGHLLLDYDEVEALGLTPQQRQRFIRRIYGSAEFIRGLGRYVLWIEDEHLAEAMQIPSIAQRVEGVRTMRLASRDRGAQAMAERAHQMREMNIGAHHSIVLPGVSSENREFLPVGLVDGKSTITNLAFALYDAPLWNLALIASRLHLVWIATVCGKLETRYRYSNTLGWNTFPVPRLLAADKAQLTECAHNILLAREVHFPATIADLYAEGAMPDNLRAAHAFNDEVIERIYIGRRFKNDTERLEKLFALYTQMTEAASQPASKGRNRKTAAQP
ncbi:class I SAM-dependent DNA methyltransferase [Allofranklinella schreckenbergeri]|uniref:site-specific DNA-methyltransferase (adenine-specific) n=1 Tax=Allofranklinella schreckenbergeri TaxID=1076744 RepID=A0A3M6QD70_9BURK|nr:DNA methyltransferase [Allofranklinella schreckenbergeri]RMX01000.1 class I SAM-dependent DNA methyltransferase [Allofranklinella schreckenbergeri]